MSKNKKVLALVFSVLVSVLIFIFRGKLSFFQDWGYLGIFILNLVSSASVIVPTIPGALATFVGGGVLNPFLVGIFAAMGSAIGEMTGYLAGLGGKELIKEDRRVKKIQALTDKYGLWVIFVLAAVPNPFFDVAGIIAGASEVPVNKYLFAVFAGKLIKFTVLSFVGYGIYKR